MELTPNARRVLEARYLLRDRRGEVIETPEGLIDRVARAAAAAEGLLGDPSRTGLWRERFHELLSSLSFLPNTPALMNAGLPRGQLAACFVLPVGDSLRSIFRSVTNMALINQSGGGTGFSFSKIRPRGDFVKSSKGVASGPLSFIHVFDTATRVIKQGGKRRGANMGVLRADHPDIGEFIRSKRGKGEKLTSFNLSVSLDDAFMEALDKKGDYALRNPRSGRKEGSVPARELFREIAEAAHACGDPGVLFIDEVNRRNPLRALGDMECTNPCGEQPLLPYEACVLGSLNLGRMLRGGDLDWRSLRRTVSVAVRFLDNLVEVNRYPLPVISRTARAGRKIGLGVMGFADALIALRIPYDSRAAVDKAREIMAVINEEAVESSRRLAKERGPFTNFAESVYARRSEPPLRNATVTTVAPTGSISLIAGCSGGIEPLFGLCFNRRVLDGKVLREINASLLKELAGLGLDRPEVIDSVRRRGSIQHLEQIPRRARRLFKTVFEIPPARQIEIQAAFQKHTHNAVSKTINFPPAASVENIEEAYLLAHRSGCKGITVYRYGSRAEQPLQLGDNNEKCRC